MEPRLVEQLLAPPIATSELPGIGGVIRSRPEDFDVTEIPAYPPDGRDGGHVFVSLRKRGLATHEAIDELARQLRVAARDIGFAGRKDKDAHTTQWISLPSTAVPRLESFTHPSIDLGPPMPHSHKLRTGHLHGNRFAIIIRELAVPVSEAVSRSQEKLERLAMRRGIDNVYGPQRFGRNGSSFTRGLEDLRRGHGGARGNMNVAAAQAGLFNLYVVLRRERDHIERVLEGDILKKTDSGGMFISSEPEVDTARLRAGEIELTGPIFGSRMKSPPTGSPAEAFEREILELAGIAPEVLSKLSRSALGTRRPLRVRIEDAHVAEASVAAMGPEHGRAQDIAVRVEFTLPAGSFATRVCEELQEPR